MLVGGGSRRWLCVVCAIMRGHDGGKYGIWSKSTPFFTGFVRLCVSRDRTITGGVEVRKRYMRTPLKYIHKLYISRSVFSIQSGKVQVTFPSHFHTTRRLNINAGEFNLPLHKTDGADISVPHHTEG